MLAAGPACADSGVWVIQGASNRVYIAGSIHLLRPGNDALPSALQRAYADAERLVLELDLDDLDQMQVAGEMMRAGMRTDGKTLSASLSAAQAARLTRKSEELGLPIALLDGFEPWLASLMLTSVSLIKQGYSAESGVDQQLASRARADRKSVTGLETPAQQFAAFDRLNASAQLHLLTMTLDELDKGGAELSAIEQAWRSGNTEKMARALGDEMADFPELEAALLTNRNRMWLPAIRAMQSGSDDVLVVVGAAHLLGDSGIIALLRASGQKPLPFPKP